MIYRTFYQPDQGYYTQQPATVAQVNNLWGFVKTMRDELSHAVAEFNSHEFDLEKNFDEAHKHTDNVKTELSKRLDKLQQDFDSLDALLGETSASLEKKITNLEDEKVSDVFLSGEDDTVKMGVSNGTSTEYENVRFTTTENETAVTTRIHEYRDGVINVHQSAPYLADTMIAGKFSVDSDGPNVALTSYADYPLTKIELASDLLGLDIEPGNKVVIDSEGAERTLNRVENDIDEINNTAQSVENSRVFPRELDDEINVTIRSESLDGETWSEQNIPLVSDGGQFSTKHGKIRYEPDDEFTQKFEDMHVSTAWVDPENLKIHSETAVWRYDPESEKIERGDSYDPETLVFDGSGSDSFLAHFVFDTTRGLVAVDTSRLEEKYDEYNTATQNVLDELLERIDTLEGEVSLMKARETNSVVQAKPVIRATSNDKIEIVLERIYANGEHDESDPIILNFRNNDHTMSIITRNNQTVSSQCDVQINLDKIWLNRQGLDRDMDTY